MNREEMERFRETINRDLGKLQKSLTELRNMEHKCLKLLGKTNCEKEGKEEYKRR